MKTSKAQVKAWKVFVYVECASLRGRDLYEGPGVSKPAIPSKIFPISHIPANQRSSSRSSLSAISNASASASWSSSSTNELEFGVRVRSSKCGKSDPASCETYWGPSCVTETTNFWIFLFFQLRSRPYSTRIRCSLWFQCGGPSVSTRDESSISHIQNVDKVRENIWLDRA